MQDKLSGLGVTAQRPAVRLVRMALPHATPGQVIDLQPLGAELGAAVSHALVKSRDLELMRLVLGYGKSLPPHRVPGEVTVLCLEGRLEVMVDERRHELTAGQLVLFAGDALHSVLALEDASALVTVVLPR